MESFNTSFISAAVRENAAVSPLVPQIFHIKSLLLYRRIGILCRYSCCHQFEELMHSRSQVSLAAV